MDQPAASSELAMLVVSSDALAESGCAAPETDEVRLGSTHLASAFLATAAAAAERPALVLPDAVWSYDRLRKAVLALAQTLQSRPGFDRDRPTVILMGNSPDYIVAFYGVLQAGGIAVPLSPSVEPQRLKYVVSTCDARLLLTDGTTSTRRRELLAALCQRPLDQVPAPGAERVTGPVPPDLAAILFTTGSTGEPKGVMLSHRNLISNALAIQESLSITADERALAVLPFCHAFGNSVLQSHLLAGAALVLDGTPAFPETLLDAIREHSATSLAGVPELFHSLLSRTTLGRRPLPSLRSMSVAGGALDPQRAAEVADRIAPAKFYVMYGQTEATARLSLLPPDEFERRPGSVGRGLTGVELQVVGTDDLPVAPGETGEIRARGPGVMQGYWHSPEATAEVLRRGWLYTGDLATVDGDGFVYPSGRRSALVKVNGYRIHPHELEEFASERFPGVEAVAVPYDGAAGTRLALFVRPSAERARLSKDDISRACLRELPRHKVPEHIEIVTEFPLTDNLKIHRPSLAARARARRPHTLHPETPARTSR